MPFFEFGQLGTPFQDANPWQFHRERTFLENVYFERDVVVSSGASAQGLIRSANFSTTDETGWAFDGAGNAWIYGTTTLGDLVTVGTINVDTAINVANAAELHIGDVSEEDHMQLNWASGGQQIAWYEWVDPAHVLYAYILGQHSDNKLYFDASGGLQFNDNANFDGTLDVTGATTLDSTLDVVGAVELDSTLKVVNGFAVNETPAATSPRMKVYGGSGDEVFRLERNTSTTSATVGRIRSAVGGAGTTTAYVRADGNWYNTNGTYGTISDRSLKTDIRDYRDASDDLRAIRVRTFEFLNRPGFRQLGYVAQEMRKVKPGFVDRTGKGADGEPSHLTVKTTLMIPLLHRGWQAHDDRIERLEAQVAELRDLVASLL